MMKRRALSIALVLLMVLALVPASFAAKTTLIYQMGADAEIQDLAADAVLFSEDTGFADDFTTYLKNSGGKGKVIEELDGAKIIAVKDREGSHDGLDITAEKLGMVEGKTYRVTFDVATKELKDPKDFGRDAQGAICITWNAGNGVVDGTRQDLVADTTYKLVAEGVLGTDFDGSGIRIQTAGGDTSDIYILDITVEEVTVVNYKVTYQMGADAEIQDLAADAVLFSEDTGFADDFTTYLKNSGGKGKVIEELDGAKIIAVKDREGSHDGLDITAEKLGMVEGKTYRVTFDVATKELKDPKDFGRDAQGAICITWNAGNGVVDGTRQDLVADTTYKLVAEGVLGTDFDGSGIRIQTAGGDTSDIYILDITVEEEVTAASASVVTEPTLVWELTAAEIEEFLGSTAGKESTDNLANAGDGAKFLTADGDSMVFAGDRPNDYTSVDLKVKDICKAGKQYTLVVEMKAESAMTLKLAEAGGSYATLASADEAESATLTCKIKNPAANVRFQVGDNAVGFTIVSAKLYLDADVAVAKPSAQAVSLDGEDKDPDRYNIDGFNYFKLRDVASLLSGTDAQFDIGFDEVTRTITITTGSAYTPTGNENGPKGTIPKEAAQSGDKIILDGKEVSLVAYKIDGSNYFQLRDLAAKLGFSVKFDEATKTMVITSSK